MATESIQIDVRKLYDEQAKLEALHEYETTALHLAGEGNNVVLTGQGPIWLYLRLAHRLHGVARRLTYRSPVTGDVLVFSHDPH